MSHHTATARPPGPAPARPRSTSFRDASPPSTLTRARALGPLRDLPGSWSGSGFSLRPRPDSAAGPWKTLPRVARLVASTDGAAGVLLDFDGLHYPHVTTGTLRKIQ